MTTATTQATGEAEIRALIEDRAKAVRAKNVECAICGVGPEVLSFDVVNPLRRIGSAETKKRAEEWFSSFEGPIGFEICDLSITAGADVAFSHALHRVSGATHRGPIGMWLRSTACYRKTGGKWTMVHEHQSVPFDPETGAASLDLEP